MMSNTTTSGGGGDGDGNATTIDDLDCPEYGEYSDYYIGQVNFWVEGVLQTALAIPGLIGKLLNPTRSLDNFFKKLYKIWTLRSNPLGFKCRGRLARCVEGWPYN